MMRRAAFAAIGILFVSGLVAVPPAAAENPVCLANVCAFLSPSRNLSCEIDFHRDQIPDETYCQTNEPPRSVHLSSNGALKNCDGDSCLGNPGQGTPILAYGQSAGLGPFTCHSESAGVTCTVTSGRGFSISTSGVTPVG
jgi:hypothetical protein